MIKPVAARLRSLLEENPSRSSFSLLMTGHSAGGAVASLLYAHMLAEVTKSELNTLTGCTYHTISKTGDRIANASRFQTHPLRDIRDTPHLTASSQKAHHTSLQEVPLHVFHQRRRSSPTGRQSICSLAAPALCISDARPKLQRDNTSTQALQNQTAKGQNSEKWTCSTCTYAYANLHMENSARHTFKRWTFGRVEGKPD